MADKQLVTRTSKGLVETLFSTIDRLNAKEIDAEQARAISHTAKSIVNVARLELDYKRYAEETKNGEQLASLQIAAP